MTTWINSMIDLRTSKQVDYRVFEYYAQFNTHVGKNYLPMNLFIIIICFIKSMEQEIKH